MRQFVRRPKNQVFFSGGNPCPFEERTRAQSEAYGRHPRPDGYNVTPKDLDEINRQMCELEALNE